MGLRVPHALEGDPEVLKLTVSPDTEPLAALTVAVTVEVECPSAGTLDGLADTVIVAEVCAIVTVPLWLCCDSVAVTVQFPCVVDEV